MNISESNKVRKLLTPEEVRNKLGNKKNIISIAGLYPMMGVKIRYFEEKYFASKTHKVYGIPKTDRLYDYKEENKNNIKAIKDDNIDNLEEKMMRMNNEFLKDFENNEIILSTLETIEQEEIEKLDIFPEVEEEVIKEMAFSLEDNEGVVDPEEDFDE